MASAGDGSSLAAEESPSRLLPTHAAAAGQEEEESSAYYARQLRQRQCIQYHIIAAPSCEDMAHQLVAAHPSRFTYHPTKWEKFPDGTDRIDVGGFRPRNVISGQRVLFLASFHSNDVTLSQFHVMICLLQSFVREMVVVLPYSPVGTMDRVVREGQVATAATQAHVFGSLPNCGTPTRLMIYDLHTLQNRFYLTGNAVASLHTAIPLLKDRIRNSSNPVIDCVAFPDDGAAKRFGVYFDDMNVRVIVCGKTRGDNDRRTVRIQEGDATHANVVVVDDLVQTGGTLHETGKVLLEAGAASVCAYVTHAVFPGRSWERFNRGGDRACFQKFWVTNSIPTVTNELPVHDGVFEVLDLTNLIVSDLDHFSSNHEYRS